MTELTFPCLQVQMDIFGRLSREPWWPEGLYRDTGDYFRYLADDLDRPTFSACASAIGRIDGPKLLFDLYFGRALDLTLPEMAGAVADVWCGAEYPQRQLGSSVWRMLFQENSFSYDGAIVERPDEAVVVYRGCRPGGRFGMSWTTDLEIARRFANGGIRGRKVGQVYVATVQSKYLLAYIGDVVGRGESEYVVDLDGLSDQNVCALSADVLSRDVDSSAILPRGEC